MDNLKIEINKINKNSLSIKEKKALFRLLQLSEYDFSEIILSDVNDDGIYEYPYFDRYLTDNKRHIFTLKVEQSYAGIALINDVSYVISDPDRLCMAEFFILKKYRRKGLGKTFAFEIFNTLRGNWELFQHDANIVATKFWTSIIKEYSEDNFKIVKAKNDDDFEGQVIIFNNSLK